MGQHLAAFEHHMVFEALKGNACIGQGANHLGVPCQGLGLVVMVGEHRLHAQLNRQFHDLVHSLAMAHQQACISLGGPLTPSSIQLGNRRVDEGHAAVLGLQFAQNGGVKHKRAVHMVAVAQGVAERGVVVQAQIASEPDQNAGEIVQIFVRHVHLKICS